MKTNPKNNNLPKQNNQGFFFTKINLKHKQNHKQSPSH